MGKSAMKCLISATLLMAVLFPLSGCSIEPSETDEPEIEIEFGENDDQSITIDPNTQTVSNDGAEADEPDEAPEITLSYVDQYTYDAAWGMLIDVCRSEGIDDDRCKCLMDLVVAKHGIDAAMYVAMEGHMHEGPAAALRAEIGEDRAIGASELYGHEQDLRCAYIPSGDKDADGASAGDTAMDIAAEAEAVAHAPEGVAEEGD